MKQISLLLATALLSVSAAACQQPSMDEQVANATSAQINAGTVVPNGNDVVAVDHDSASPTPSADGPEMNAIHPIPGKAADNIPVAFQGRWGMVPLDCTGDPAAAKGLIVIGPDRIKFYEATAMLASIATNDPTHYVGNFDFTGEGQTWKKSEDLKLSGGGKALVRTDDEGSYKYNRCA